MDKLCHTGTFMARAYLTLVILVFRHMITQKFECYIVKEVIEVKELNEETNFAAAGKQDK